MILQPFYFELKDVLIQFVAAFDDVVINRYNKKRQLESKINVRYVYAPKQRVLYDIINPEKTMTLPAIAVNITNVSRDVTRVFNKIDGFQYGNVPVLMPVPVNISVSMSIITRYQSDMDQILSNFVPYCNPYIIISWAVPSAFGLTVPQEIRSEVLWDGNIALEYPTDIKGEEKARMIGTTSFIIKGWLFKDVQNNTAPIYYIRENFNAASIISNYAELSATSFTYPLSTGLINELETFELSGGP